MADGRDVILFKGSSLSLFSDIRIENANKGVQTFPSSYYYNNYAQVLSHTEDYSESGIAERLFFSYDNVSQNVPDLEDAPNDDNQSTYPLSLLDGVVNGAVVSGGNDALKAGSDAFFAQFAWNAGTTTYNGVVSIKLRDLCGFFAALDFPLVMRPKIYLYFNFVNGMAYGLKNISPLQYLSSTGITSTPAAQVPLIPLVGEDLATPTALTLTIINTGNLITGFDSCMLFYKEIGLNPDEGKKFEALYKSNRTKQISFPIADVWDQLRNQAGGATPFQTVGYQISPGLSRLSKVLMAMYSTGQLISTSSPGPTFNPNLLANLSQFNISFNGLSNVYYISDLLTDQEFWDELMNTTGTYGLGDSFPPLIEYNEWYRENSLYAFDLTRMQTRQSSSQNTSVWVRFTNQGNTNVNPNIDYVFILERQVSMQIRFTEFGCQFEEIKTIING